MAQEEIKLVGSFKDDITPSLKKLNRELNNIARSFERFNKKIAPVTKSFAKMAMSARAFGDAMKSQRAGIETSARAMREYSRQAGKMSSAMRKVSEQRIKAQRAMGVSRAQARKGGTGTPVGAGGAGGGAAYGASAAKGFNSGIGSIAIGSAIGNMASMAIMRGMSGLSNMVQAPFKKFMSAFSERIGDEMDDIKSAGGLFALDMDLTQESGNERFFKNYNESLRFQEKLNIDMAQSAAALPGVTSQYVSTSRQLTDTIQMVMEKDRESFNKMAARYGADISQGGTDAAKNAMQTILKKQTEQVVLQSQGQKGGLPMHIAIQQLMGKEAKNGKIGVQAFTNKFRAAFQKNPLLKNFLIRAEEDLAKTDAGSVERLQKIIEVFDAAMPVEVINKMRGSISGMQEALRSGLMDPQAGLFGMSRAVFAEAGTDAQFVDESGKLLKKNVNDFGEFIYKFSEDFNDAEMAKKIGVTEGENLKGQELTLKQLKKLNLSINKNNQIIDAQGNIYGEISRSNTYLFEQIREILAGFGPVLLEFVGFLPMLFDPFSKMTQSLIPLRDAAQEFVAGFNNNVNAIEKEAQAYASSSDATTAGLGNTLKGQSRGRAAIGKVVTFLEKTGGIEQKIADDIFKVVEDTSVSGIKDYDKTITTFIEPLFRSLIESDLAKSLSKGFGQIVGGIVRTVYDMITGVFSLAEGGAANTIVDGFKEGFGSMFEDLPMSKVTGVLTGLMNMIFLKIADILIYQVLPTAAMALIQGLTGLVLSGNPVGMILGALGLVKIGGLIFSAVSLIGGLFSTLAGIVGFVTANFALLSGIVGTVVVAVVAPVLAVAGAVMLVISVFRHLDFITSSVVEGFKILYNAFVWMDSTIKAGILNFVASLMEGLAKVPIIGGTFQGGAAKAREEADLQSNKAMQAQTNMAKSLDIIAQNTSDSFKRTKEDFSMLSGGPGVSGSAPSPANLITSSPRGRSGASKAKGISPATPGAAPAFGVPTPEQTGVAAVTTNTQELIEPTIASSVALTELPMKMDEVAMRQTMELSTVVGTYLAEVCAKMDEVIIAAGNFGGGGGAKVASLYKGNVFSAAGGMNLGSAIATEMKHKPAGSDLVIANSSETIIPASMSAGMGGSGGSNMSVGDITVNVSGVDDPKAIANQVADEILSAMQRATYSEINIS